MAAVVFPRVRDPRVSILMVTYGGWEFVSRALRSLLENTEPCYEVIIVDNASPDDTAPRLRDEVVNARVVFNEVNRGFGPANNQAASLAVAPFLLLLNSDCFVQSGWLPPLLSALEGDAAIGAVAPMILNTDGSLQESGSLLYRAKTQFYGFADDWGKAEYRFPRSVDYASGACLLVRRRAFLDVGGFDVAYAPAYFEDVDLCLHLKRRGLRTLVEPRSVVTHVRGASTRGEFITKLLSRNFVLFKERWNAILGCRPAFAESTPQRGSFWARDAGAPARLLVVTEQAPSPRHADGDPSVYHLIETLAAGWPECRITALTPAHLTDPDAFEDLVQRGIEVAAGLPDPARWLADRRLLYDAVLFGDGRSADLFREALDVYQSVATRIEGAARLDYGSLVGALGRAGVAPQRVGGAAREGGRRGTPGTVGPGAGRFSRPVALLVLGMHRSGTSALSGCLYHLRVRLGGPLMAANFANERGYFEHSEVVSIHDDLLSSFGSSALEPALGPALFPAGWEESPAARTAKARLRNLVFRNFSGARLWTLKDPRLCILLPLWLTLLEEMEIEPRFILMLRSPWEIVRSLKLRDGLVTSESLDLWFRHSTESEAMTRGRPRAFATYDELLSRPEDVLACLAEELHVTWPEALGSRHAGIRAFLEPSLRHSNRVRPESDVSADVVLQVRDLYDAFRALQEDDSPANHRLVDGHRAACDAALAVFRRSRVSDAGPAGGGNIHWLSVDAPPRMEPGESASVRASFSHEGSFPLSGRALFVSYHWLDADDPSRVVVWEGERTPVRRALTPGEKWGGEVAVQAPAAPGRYLLQLDLVREGVAWFSRQGGPTTETVVKVG